MSGIWNIMRAAFRNLVLPGIIAAAVQLLIGVIGFVLWLGINRLSPLVDRQFKLRSADYLSNLIERIQSSIYDLTVAAGVIALIAALAWFAYGWWVSSKLSGPGQVSRHLWVWLTIGCVSLVLYLVIGGIIVEDGGLWNKIKWAFFGVSASYLVGFGLLYWLGTLFGTPAKLRPAVPLSASLPAKFHW